MSEQQQNSEETNRLSKIREELGQVRELLRQKGIEPDSLVLLKVHDETIIGETVDEVPMAQLVGTPLRIKNPRRVLRIQRTNGENYSVNFNIIDYDMMEEGYAIVSSAMTILLKLCCDETQYRYLGMLFSSLQHKERAKEISRGGSRIIRPDLEVPPGITGPHVTNVRPLR